MVLLSRCVLFLFLCVCSFTGFAQRRSISGFDPFIDYVGRHFRLPEAVRQDCHWHYAIVKVSTNKAGVITRYKLINIDAFGDAMADSFKYLIGYRFPKKLNISQRPVVFCITVNNEKLDCVPEQATQNPPSETVARVLAAFQSQWLKQPNTLFIYDFAESIIYDTSK